MIKREQTVRPHIKSSRNCCKTLTFWTSDWMFEQIIADLILHYAYVEITVI